MKTALILMAALLFVAFSGISEANTWESKCLMCHREGNTLKAPTKEALLEKYKTEDAFIQAAKASKNPMMKNFQKDEILNKVTLELYK